MIAEVIPAGIIIGVIGGALGLGLSWASKVFHVEVDERINKVREVLPGANCGACAYAGCDAYAGAVVSGEAKTNMCTVGGDLVAKSIAEIMGVEAETAQVLVAKVMCNGRFSVSLEKYNYSGIDDCNSAASLFGGHKSCIYGCLGHGTCVKACPFNATTIVNGVAIVIEERCKACGICVEACPKNLIEMVPKDSNYSVMCKSQDKGAVTKKNCGVGCIGCKLCVKACPVDAITVDGFLAKIDTSKCTNCGECAKVCPTMAIRKI